jgi:hypothetical protein
MRPGKDGLRGILQLEYRANPKTGTQREPDWYLPLSRGGQAAHPLRGRPTASKKLWR